MHCKAANRSTGTNNHLLLTSDLIVASAGDDKKISLWHKKGQNVGQLPTSTVDRGDDIEVSDINMIMCSCIMPNNMHVHSYWGFI